MIENNNVTKEEFNAIQSNTDAPGKTMLKIGGIGITVLSALDILGGLILLLFGLYSIGSIEEFGIDASMVGFIGGIVAVFAFGLIIGRTFSLVAGIMGIRRANKVEKYKPVFVIGIILVVFKAFGLMSSSLMSGSELLAMGFPIVGALIADAVFVVLYLVGACKNRRAYLDRDLSTGSINAITGEAQGLPYAEKIDVSVRPMTEDEVRETRENYENLKTSNADGKIEEVKDVKKDEE